MSDLVKKDLGTVSAYKYAKLHGYTGTEEEFGVLMASYASVAQEANHSASSAAEAAQFAMNEAYKATQSATNAHTDAETATTAKDDAVSAKNEATNAKDTAITTKNEVTEIKNVVNSAKQTAIDQAKDSEAWATGQRDGTDVPDTDEAFHNNAKYYNSLAASYAGDAQGAVLNASKFATDAGIKANEAKQSAQSASQSAEATRNLFNSIRVVDTTLEIGE